MTNPLSIATVPVIRAMLDYACRKNYTSGVLGVRAQPEWSGVAEFSHDGTTVRVVPCESVLAVWEAIIARDRSQWLVVLTDRGDDDLVVVEGFTSVRSVTLALHDLNVLER